jgi:hypothetical protein
LASPIIRSAASRIRVVHIFVRKLKLSSRIPTTRGREAASAAVNSSSPSESIASKRATGTPRSRRTAAVTSVASGG